MIIMKKKNLMIINQMIFKKVIKQSKFSNYRIKKSFKRRLYEHKKIQTS